MLLLLRFSHLKLLQLNRGCSRRAAKVPCCWFFCTQLLSTRAHDSFRDAARREDSTVGGRTNRDKASVNVAGLLQVPLLSRIKCAAITQSRSSNKSVIFRQIPACNKPVIDVQQHARTRSKRLSRRNGNSMKTKAGISFLKKFTQICKSLAWFWPQSAAAKPGFHLSLANPKVSKQPKQKHERGRINVNPVPQLYNVTFWPVIL